MDMRTLNDAVQDAWNNRDQQAFLALYDEEHEVTAPGFTGKGAQGLLDFWALWMGAFPDNRTTVRTLVVEGSTMAGADTFQGTHTGPLMSADGTAIPPTGRQVSVNFSAFVTVRNDRITRTEFYFDQLELLGQLGLAPA